MVKRWKGKKREGKKILWSDLGGQPRSYFLIDDVAMMACEVATFLHLRGFFVLLYLLCLAESLNFSPPFAIKGNKYIPKELCPIKEILNSLPNSPNRHHFLGKGGEEKQKERGTVMSKQL